MADKIQYAQLLSDASEVKITTNDKSALHTSMSVTTPEGGVTLHLPVIKPDVIVPVVELFLK